MVNDLHPLAIANFSSCIQRPNGKIHKNHPGKLSDPRSEFQRDRDRILYSKSFRRLMHKTQVSFTGSMNEHIRTRLTHTLEVSQIARSIARAVNVNEDLTEAIALGHDVGHTPFGHTGEKLLNNFLNNPNEIFPDHSIKIPNIGFKHNFQSVRVLCEKERGYSEYEGLNLTYPVLEGIIKHSKLYYKSEDDVFYSDISTDKNLFLDQGFSASVEGQIVNLADEIAQVCHDIEDSIIAQYDSKEIIIQKLEKIINDKKLFNKLGDSIKDNSIKFLYFSSLPDGFIKIKMDVLKEFIGWIIGIIVSDAIDIIKTNMDNFYKKHQHFNKNNEFYPICENIATEDHLKSINLFKNLREIQVCLTINNYKIHRENGKAKYILRKIIGAYLSDPRQMPDKILMSYSRKSNEKAVISKLKELDENYSSLTYLPDEDFQEIKDVIINDELFLRLVCDYISSMTDFYAYAEYRKLYLEESN